MSEGAIVAVWSAIAFACCVWALSNCEARDRVEFERGHYGAVIECLKRFTPKECSGL